MKNLVNTKNQAWNVVEGDSNTKTIRVLNIQTYPQGTI